MMSVDASQPLLWVPLGFVLFHFAVQRPAGPTRQLLGLSSILSLAICLGRCRSSWVPYAHVWVPVVIGLLLHTALTLFSEKLVLDTQSMQLAQGLRATFRIWTNFRKLPMPLVVGGDDTNVNTRPQHDHTSRSRSRARFALLRCTHLVGLCAVHFLVSRAMKYTLYRQLQVRLADFAPAKQWTLIPPSGLLSTTTTTTTRELHLRAVLSVHWIWNTYFLLTAAHDVLAVCFVAVLRWDAPSDWPPLFGGAAEAYTLRRFWGVFWHQLHTPSFEGYMPGVLRTTRSTRSRTRPGLSPPGYRSGWAGPCKKAGRALWIFALSALGHTAVDYLVLGRFMVVSEGRFFLSNFLVCLLETVVGRVTRCWQVPRWCRVLGYVWVFLVFFSLVPAWQYPLVHVS